MKKFNIGLAGYGTVGTSVVNIIESKKQFFNGRRRFLCALGRFGISSRRALVRVRSKKSRDYRQWAQCVCRGRGKRCVGNVRTVPTGWCHCRGSNRRWHERTLMHRCRSKDVIIFRCIVSFGHTFMHPPSRFYEHAPNPSSNLLACQTLLGKNVKWKIATIQVQTIL